MILNKKALFSTVVAGLLGTLQTFAQDVQTGIKDLEAGRYTKAIQTFQSLTGSAPSADNFFYLGMAQLRSGNIDAAKQSFEKGVAADPKNQLNNVGLGAVALAKKDRATAQNLINGALSATKNKNLDILLRAGEVYTMFPESSDAAAAIAALETADKLDKKNTNADIEMALGDAFLAKNDGGAAVSKYENALMINPNSAEANYKIGKVFLRGKNYTEAQKYYEKAIATDPEYAPTYEDLAEAFFGSRAYKSASRNMDLYIQKSQTTDTDKILRSAQFDFLAGDNMRAIQKLDALKGKIDNPVIMRIYGWGYNNMGQYDKAIENLNEFIKRAPEKVIYDDYKNLGRAYGQVGTPEGDSLSIVYLLKAAPEDTTENLYKEVAKKYSDAKRYADAAAMWETALKNDKNPSANDYFQLGFAYYVQASRVGRDSLSAKMDTSVIRQTRQQLYTRADSVFSAVTEKLPEWSPGYYYRATSNYFAYPQAEALANGKAVPYYEKYLEVANAEIAKDPAKKDANKRNVMSAYKFLYAYHANKKDDAKAKEYLAKAQEFDPTDQDIQNILNPPKAAPAAKAPAKPAAPKKPAGRAVKKS